MFKNIYFYRARLFPSLLTSIPMLVFFNRIAAIKFNSALANIYEVLPIITHLGLSAAIIFLCVQVNRLIAKEIFQRLYFREELFMPSTTHLLWRDTYYIDDIKTKIRDKIELKFGISLLSLQEERQNQDRARKLIAASVAQIRVTLTGNSLLLQHNIEYGFWRNLIGGCVLAILFSVCIFIFGTTNNIHDLKTIGSLCFV